MGVLQAALDCIVTIDEHSRILEFNPAAEKTFGYRATEVIGRPMAELLIPPAWRERHQAGMDRHLASGEMRMIGRRVEIVAMRSNGSEFPCELTITRLEDNGRPVFTAFLRDITDRRAAEEDIKRLNAGLEREVALRTTELRGGMFALERTRERLESAQAIAQMGDIELDLEDGGRTWSKEVFRLHGFAPAMEPPPLEQLFARIPLADQDAVRRFAEHAARGELLDPFDYRVMWPDGSTRWLRAIGGACYDKPGGGKRLAITVHDVTERKAFERELVATIEHERELGRLKAEFLHMITHEYRTPLAVAMSAAEILEHYFDRLPAEERVEQLQKIRRETRRLANLFDDVLLLGRADAGTVVVRLQPVELSEVFRRMADEVIASLGAVRIVHLEVQGLPPRVWLDERLLRHIFTNLVHNALKYSTLDRPVWTSVSSEDGTIVLRVRDEGIGIPVADQARLFQTFQRASNVGAISGSGIGLVVVKRCVELHGGAISLQSTVGQGTEFVVRLPLTATDPSPPPSSGEIHEPDPNPSRRGRTTHARQPRVDAQDGGLRSDRSPARSRRRGGSAPPPA
jgi:PAS domain S-box-containing protein